MSYVDIPGRIYWPALWGTGSIGFDWGAKYELILDGTADRLAFVFYVPKDGTIEGLVFGTGTVTTSQSLDIRLETVDAATGHPTGTLAATGTSGTQASVGSSTQYLVALGTTYAAQAGDKLAFVIQFTSTAGNLKISAAHQSNSVITQAFPYVDHNADASWGIYDLVPNFALKIDGAYPHCGSMPFKTLALTETFATVENGMRLKIPVNVKVCGIWLRFEVYAGDTFGSIVRLWNATAVIGSGTYIASAESTGHGVKVFFFDEVEILANTVHRITVESLFPAEYELGVKIDYATVGSNAYLEAWPGGIEWYHTSSLDDGANWTDTTTQRPCAMGLIVSAIDVPAGGGLILNPGMDGGMRG